MSKPSLEVQELLDAIVDYLQDDKPTLIACSFVSRALLTSSRFHLVRELEFAKSGDAYAFFRILDVPWSGLGGFVRSITLADSTFLHGIREGLESHYVSGPWNFPQIAGHLSNLELIHWKGINWKEVPPNMKYLFIQLQFCHLHLSSFRSIDISNILSHCLNKLTLISLDDVKAPLPEDFHLHCSFPTKLHICTADIESLFNLRPLWDDLSSSGTGLTLDTLAFRSARYSSENLEVLSSILYYVGPSVRHIKIKIPPTACSVDFKHIQIGKITRCVNVKIVEIEAVQLDLDNVQSGDTSRAINNILFSLPCRTVEQFWITFKFNLDEDERDILALLRQVEWRLLVCTVFQKFTAISVLKIRFGAGFRRTPTSRPFGWTLPKKIIIGKIEPYIDVVREKIIGIEGNHLVLFEPCFDSPKL